jgi:hypothetical protein
LKYFIENGPKTANYRHYIYEFLQKAIFEGALYFLKANNHENDIQKSLQKEAYKKLEGDFSELKQIAYNENNIF